MKKTKSLPAILVAATACLIGATHYVAVNSELRLSRGEAESYKLRLEGKATQENANRLTTAEAAAGQFSRNTSKGNEIVFMTSGSDTISAHDGETSNQKWCDIQVGGYIYNSTPITGLTKISFAGNWDYDVRVYYGSSLNYEYSVDYRNAEDTTLSIDFESRGLAISYFKYEVIGLTNSNTSLRFLELEYSCDATPVEAQQFVAGTDKTLTLSKQYDITSDVVTIDVKFADETKKVFVSLFNSKDWDHYFGYYGLTPDQADAGITVTKLPDNYYRFELSLPELTKTNNAWNRDNVPEFVNIVYIRGNWTTATGYVELEPKDYHFISNRGKAFTGGKDCQVALSGVTYTSIVTVDFKFTTLENATYPRVRFMIGNWNEYYGYFSVNSDLSVTGKTGVTSTQRLIDGYIRVTIDLSIATSDSGTGTPESQGTAINFLYISDRWSGYSGYVDVVSIS